MTKLEDLPDEKIVNISLRKTHFYIYLILALIGFIGTTIVYPTVYITDKTFQLEAVEKSTINLDKRVTGIEEVIPELKSAAKNMNDVKIDLDEFKKEMIKEWRNLFQEYEIKRK